MTRPMFNCLATIVVAFAWLSWYHRSRFACLALAYILPYHDNFTRALSLKEAFSFNLCLTGCFKLWGYFHPIRMLKFKRWVNWGRRKFYRMGPNEFSWIFLEFKLWTLWKFVLAVFWKLKNPKSCSRNKLSKMRELEEAENNFQVAVVQQQQSSLPRVM